MKKLFEFLKTINETYYTEKAYVYNATVTEDKDY